jgi:hypothetical protein
MRKLLTFIVLTTCGLYSCKRENIKSDSSVENTSAELIANLKSSPENILIGDNNLFLKAYLWHDRMPGLVDDRPLICLSSLRDLNKTVIPGLLSLRKLFVVNNDEIWIADYSETRNSSAYILEGLVKKDLPWMADITVDVICEFEYDGEIFRILSKSNRITETF